MSRPLTDSLAAALAAAAERLRAGGLALFPTETLVGLGCDPRREDALERLGRLKGRPPGQPYPLLVADRADAARHAVLAPAAARLAARFWPGLLTLVLPAREGVPPTWTAADGTVALRVSGHPVSAGLVRALGGPLVATSANASGAPPPSRLGDVDPAIRTGVDVALPEWGEAPAGASSTIVRVVPGEPPRILREGAVSRAALAPFLTAEGAP